MLVAVSALQILLRRREYRPIFHAEDGVKLYACTHHHSFLFVLWPATDTAALAHAKRLPLTSLFRTQPAVWVPC